MDSFLLVTQIISIVITLSGFVLAFINQDFYIKCFPVFFGVVMSLSIGPIFWNLGIYAVDKILITNMEIEAYLALFEKIRKIMFPAGLQPFLMLVQLLLLVAMYRKAKNATTHYNHTL